MAETQSPVATGRKSARVRLSIPCDIKGAKGEARVPVRDISLDGCRILSSESYPAGEQIRLALRLSHRVEMSAEVRWLEHDSAKNHYVLGCRFVHTADSRRSLQDSLQAMVSAIDTAARKVR